MQVKKFSGRAEDFDEFARTWEQWLTLMLSNADGPLPDLMVLMFLRPSLDAASAALLDARMRADPNLGYYTFWAEFRGRFQRDVQAMHRRNWQQVKLTKQGTQPSF